MFIRSFFFFTFSCFPNIIMYILNTASALKKDDSQWTQRFYFKNYFKRIGFVKGRRYYSTKLLKIKNLLLLATKLIEKATDPRNAKKHYQSFMRKKKTKSVQQSKIITPQPKNFGNPNIADIKSTITVHPKTSDKWSKTIRQTKKSLLSRF